MPRQRKDAPLVTDHDYRTWLRWMFLKELLQAEPSQAKKLIEIAYLHRKDVMVINLWLDLEDWANQLQFRLHPWAEWVRSASHDVSRALTGHTVFANSDGSSVLPIEPTLDQVLQAAIDFHHRPVRSGNLIPGISGPEIFKPPTLPYFFPQQPYKEEQQKYEILAREVIHEFTEQVISMHAAGKKPRPSSRPNLDRQMKWLVWKLQGKPLVRLRL